MRVVVGERPDPLADVVGVAEEQLTLDAYDEHVRWAHRLLVTVDVHPEVVRVRQSAEHRDVRAGGAGDQQHSETITPMISPGSVSKSSTPSSAATAPMKSARLV